MNGVENLIRLALGILYLSSFRRRRRRRRRRCRCRCRCRVRCASQIELISGIYRAADFPFVLSLTRPTEYTSDGISLSVRRIRARIPRTYTLPLRTRDWSAANKFSTNNKSACGARWSALHAPECENSGAKSRIVPRESSRILQYVSSRSTGGDFCNWHRDKRLNISPKLCFNY